ncbi:class I SAM-dependent methyltransferase [Aeromicrobium sp.]|uniref:class I SAM-dependent methyltransferase n=1 Tax=Aeromicrobium sp. TaxID=1871063 RepID=UPI003D6B080B
MADCCEPNGYDSVFDSRFARRLSRRYRRRGLSRPSRAIVSFLAEQGVEGATVLEIGGGIGDIHVELLRRGASRATNLEISTSYEDEAASLLESAGLRDRVDRRFLDVAQEPEAVEQADIVVLHRVVCCYPDHARLLGAAASKAGRVLVFSHPPRNVVSRAALWLDNQGRKWRGETFRSFAHPPAEMMAVLARAGMRDTYRWRGFGWRVVGLEASDRGGE